MTHEFLVKRAAVWLRTHRACTVVGTEFNVQGCSESPDAIGWNFSGHCVVVECKTSLADFKNDANKFFRRAGYAPAGAERWYMAPVGVIPHDELPEGYGLIEVNTRGAFTAYYKGKKLNKAGRGWYGERKFTGADRNASTEAAILVSILRQVHMEGYAERRNLYIHKPKPYEKSEPTDSRTVTIETKTNQKPGNDTEREGENQ